MENASKALIIAGAILLSILIIAIGMYIYNSSQNSIQQAGSQISAQEISNFNQQWQMYSGNQPGSNISALISRLISNAKAESEEETRLIDLYIEYESGNAGKVVSNVSNTNIAGFNKASAAVQTRHQYYVTLVNSDTTGLVSGIVITYNKPASGTDVFAYFNQSNQEMQQGTDF